MTEYEVIIIEKKTGNVIKRMSSLSLTKAVRVQRGANLNINPNTHSVELNVMKEESDG